MKKLLLLLSLLTIPVLAQTNVTVVGNRVFGTGAPGTSTPLPVGLAVGVQYTDVSTGNAYVCTAAASTGTSCTTWTAQSGGGSPGGNTGDLQCKNLSSFSPCGSGAGTFNSTSVTGGSLITHTEAGSFANTAFNSYNFDSLCSTATPQSIFHAAGSSYNLTDARDACVQVPNSNATNGFSAALGGWAEGDNSCASCSALGTAQAAVGVVGSCYASVSNFNCYGGDFAANDKSGNTGNLLRPVEIDASLFNTGTQGALLTLAMQGTAQPTGDNFPGVTFPINSGSLVTTAYECPTGTISTASSTFGACLYAQPQATGASQGSYLVLFGANNAGNTLVQKGLQLTPTGELQTGAYLSGAVLANDVGTQTISGCSLSAASGGAGAGKFTAGTTSCTVTITPGFTASHGFFCVGQDTTTAADKLNQSGISATTCALTGTVASSDVITWFVVGF